MKQVDIRDVRQGMVLAKTLYGKNESLLMGKGVPLSQDHIDQLKRLGIQSLWIEAEEEHKTVDNEETKRIAQEIEALLDAQFQRVSHNLIMGELKRIFANYLIKRGHYECTKL